MFGTFPDSREIDARHLSQGKRTSSQLISSAPLVLSKIRLIQGRSHRIKPAVEGLP